MRSSWPIILFACLSIRAACTGSSPMWTTSADRTSVASCVSSASSGDTINISAGSATWSSIITATKSMHIIGAGSGSLTITVSSSGLEFAPASGEETKVFEVSGIHFIGNGGIDMSGWGKVPIITSLKIHDCNFTGASVRAIKLAGLEFGVFYSNTFSGNFISVSVIGAGVDANFATFAFGSADYPYFEDNSFGDGIGGEFLTETGQGGRMVFRHNTVTGYNSGAGAEVFDVHGEQESGGWTVTSEYYHNTIGLGSSPFRWMNHRGGQAVIMNNTITSTRSAVDFEFTEYQSWGGNGICHTYPIAYNSSEAYCSPISGTCLETQVHNSYYFNNITKGSQQTPSLGNATGGSCGSDPPFGDNNYIIQNREYWLPSFGLASALPGTCTADGNTFYGTTDTDVIYKCTSANTWTVFYMPYTYPHPLRGSASFGSSLSSAKINTSGQIKR